jgi:hypothetical protein
MVSRPSRVLVVLLSGWSRGRAARQRSGDSELYLQKSIAAQWPLVLPDLGPLASPAFRNTAQHGRFDIGSWALGSTPPAPAPAIISLCPYADAASSWALLPRTSWLGLPQSDSTT